MRRHARWTSLLCCALALLAGCAGGPVQDLMLVRGQLDYRNRIALPPDAVAVVELTRTQDGRVLAEQRIPLNGRQVPVPFALNVRRAFLQNDVNYALRGTVEVQGQAAWLSEPLDVRSASGVVNVGTLTLRPWDAVAFASRLDCGQRTARVGVVRGSTGDVTRLTVDGERFELQGIVSASGARYEAVGDPTTQLWVKGDLATLTLRGQMLPECTVTRDAPDAVRARGNEPSWNLELGTTLRFSTPDVILEGTAPGGQVIDGVRRHAGIVNGRSVNVTLTPRTCRDSMSGMPFPYVAEVIVSGRTFRGCGGESDALLMGREWIVEDIGGRGIVDRSRATLDFGADGRLAGRASCNAYTSSYVLTGESLTIGTTATTMMSCPPALIEQERRFLDILQRVRGFDVTDTGALVLSDDRGQKITARR